MPKEGGGGARKEIGKVGLVFEEPWFCCFGERKRKEGKAGKAFRGFKGKVIPPAFRGRKPSVLCCDGCDLA